MAKPKETTKNAEKQMIGVESLFLQYEQGENALTKALLHVLESGGEKLLKYISEELDLELPFPLLEFSTQKKCDTTDAKGNDRRIIYDGRIAQCNFELIIESKITENAINDDQLERQFNFVTKQKANGCNSKLLYVTPDKNRPAKLNEEKYKSVIWTSWKTMIDSLQTYSNGSDVTETLLDGMRGLYENLLADNISAENRVLILAGSNAEPVALEKGYYHCQVGRKFKDSAYLAFYHGKAIRNLFKITNGPYSYEGDDPEIGKGATMMELELVKELETPIQNDKKKGDKTVAFTQGSPRYCSLETFNNARVTSDLEK